MKKKFGAFGARQFSLDTLVGGRPGTTIFQNPGGGGGWGGGGSHTRTGPGRPPVGGGGSKLLCVLWPLCVYLDLGPKEVISCIWTPNHGGPRSPLRVPLVAPLPYGPFLGRTWVVV